MKITKLSSVTGKYHTMDLDVTEEQLKRFESGEGLIQHIFPHLSDDQREFLLSGITPQEWNVLFPPEDEE